MITCLACGAVYSDKAPLQCTAELERVVPGLGHQCGAGTWAIAPEVPPVVEAVVPPLDITALEIKPTKPARSRT